MQELLTCLISGASGAITGAIQWQIYIRDPELKKSFRAHLEDLRLHWLIAVAVMLVVAGFLAIVQDWHQVLKWVPMAFMLPWVGVVVFKSWRFLRASPSSSTSNQDVG